MKIQTLVSTMDLKNVDKLLSEMNVSGDFVIINQSEGVKYQEKGTEQKKIIDVDEKGLSKSRNLALENCINEIALISDDDIEYVDGYEKIIEDGYEKFPDADAIAFYLDSDDEKNKKPRLKEGRVHGISYFKIASVQLAIKANSLKKSNIKFDENFGAGSEYFMGEENILLSDMKRKGLKIYSCPIKIGTVREKRESTWFKKYDEKYFESRGAGYYRMSKILCPFYILQFAIRKNKLYRKNIHPFKAVEEMFIGVCEYKRQKRNNLILFVGEFELNNGPANANREFLKSIEDSVITLKRRNKILRSVELFVKSIKVRNVCFCSFSKINIFGIKIAKKFNIKTNYLVHGCVKFEKDYSGNISDDMLRTEEYIFQNVDNIICVSRQLADKVKSIYPTTKHVDTVYNIMEKQKNNKQCKKIEEFKTIISTGGDWLIKNNLSVCDAIQKINKSTDLKLKYVIAGQIEDSEKFKKYDFVELLGSLPKEDFYLRLKNSDIFIQNSIFDSFPLSTLEALNNGCSVIMSKNVGTKEIIKTTNEDDIINNPDDIDEISQKIIKIIKNPNNDRLESGILWNMVSGYWVSHNLKKAILSKNSDKVSIIVPAYNTEKYIGRCLKSLSNQTYKNIEIIVVNDGSTDNTQKIIDSYAEHDSRIKTIVQENMSANIARGRGVKNASGKYCMFIDSDDWLDRRTVSVLINNVGDADIIKFNARIEPRRKKMYNDEYFKKHTYDSQHEIKKKLFTFGYFFRLMSTNMYKTSLFSDTGMFSLASSFGEDYIVNMATYSKAKKIRILNKSLYHYYTLNQNSTTKSSDFLKMKRNSIEAQKLYEKMIDNAKKWSIYDDVERDLLVWILNTEVWNVYGIMNSNGNEREKVALLRQMLNAKAMLLVKNKILVDDLKSEPREVRKMGEAILNSDIKKIYSISGRKNIKMMFRKELKKCF